MSGAGPTLIVGVFPAAERERLRLLFGALEAAFPVHFEGRRDGALRDLDAVLELGTVTQGAAAGGTGTPALSLLAPEPAVAGAPAVLELGETALERCLHHAQLPDERLGAAIAAGVALVPSPGAAVLASAGGTPAWARRGNHEVSLLHPLELEPEEALRDRLRDGRSAALLPLVHFLRQLGGGWQPPPLRASFLFDDPNLHWPSYGFVKLDALGRHARTHGYHASLATVPLDAWFAHPGALRTLRQSGGAISLSVHGNDHYGAELGQLRNESDAVALGAQALRRMRAFERRTGVPVDPVMVPPHERCSETTLSGLRRCGFAGITMTTPYPWLAQPPQRWLARPAEVGPLAGWRPADLVDGLPVFLRHPFPGRSQAELTLRAFLGQPLILYGHQEDLLDGLGVLAAAAADVRRLGPVQWGSLSELAASNYERRQAGAQLALRLLTRRAIVEIPATAEQLLVTLPPEAGNLDSHLLVNGLPQRLDQPLAVAPGSTVTVELHPADAVDPSHVPPPPRQPLAIPRRVLSESRDRLAPLLARAR
ncbi:MAG TPA: hypothetical protein VFX85_02060 [Solirubrobacterales bacterium]|nr:hypothetical protein [Solirubrobacterales bacterium]